MSPDFSFFSVFVQGLSTLEVFVAFIGIISAAAFAGFWATKLGQKILPQPYESRVADFLPFNKLMSDGITIRCYNGAYARVFRVTGVDLTFATEEKSESMFEARKSWIDNMSDMQIICRVITMRERISLEENQNNFNNPLLEQISHIWEQNLDRVYTNTHYIILSVLDRPDALKDLNYASPLFENKEVVEYPCDQATTTYRYFNKAMEFIGENKNKPFFVYLTPAMPHVPLYVSEQFKGKSKRGLYGDAVEEIDWNVGRLMEYLDKEGLSENTVVIFSSDNGPWLGMKENGGSALPLRDGKFSAYEGGVRTPCIIKWKNNIPQGKVSDNIIASIDIYPTLLDLAGIDKSAYDLDGTSLKDFILNPDNVKPRDEYLYVKDGKIMGIRKNEWVYLPQTGKRFTPKGNFEQELFNIKSDIGQKSNIISQNPEKLMEMKKLLDSKLHK